MSENVSYYIYENEDDGRRSVVEVPGGEVAPIHISNDDGTWERCDGPFQASSLEDAFDALIGGEKIRMEVA